MADPPLDIDLADSIALPDHAIDSIFPIDDTTGLDAQFLFFDSSTLPIVDVTSERQAASQESVSSPPGGFVQAPAASYRAAGSHTSQHPACASSSWPQVPSHERMPVDSRYSTAHWHVQEDQSLEAKSIQAQRQEAQQQAAQQQEAQHAHAQLLPALQFKPQCFEPQGTASAQGWQSDGALPPSTYRPPTRDAYQASQPLGGLWTTPEEPPLAAPLSATGFGGNMSPWPFMALPDDHGTAMLSDQRNASTHRDAAQNRPYHAFQPTRQLSAHTPRQAESATPDGLWGMCENTGEFGGSFDDEYDDGGPYDATFPTATTCHSSGSSLGSVNDTAQFPSPLPPVGYGYQHQSDQDPLTPSHGIVGNPAAMAAAPTSLVAGQGDPNYVRLLEKWVTNDELRTSCSDFSGDLGASHLPKRPRGRATVVNTACGPPPEKRSRLAMAFSDEPSYPNTKLTDPSTGKEITLRVELMTGWKKCLLMELSDLVLRIPRCCICNDQKLSRLYELFNQPEKRLQQIFPKPRFDGRRRESLVPWNPSIYYSDAAYDFWHGQLEQLHQKFAADLSAARARLKRRITRYLKGLSDEEKAFRRALWENVLLRD